MILDLQAPTKVKSVTADEIELVDQAVAQPTPEPTVNPLWEKWIDFCACGGMIVGEDGAINPTTITAFAKQLGVSRDTLYNWKQIIPDFQIRVKARSKEIGGGNEKLIKAWNGIYLKTCAGNAEAAKLYFTNFDKDFKMPTIKTEQEIGDNFAALLQMARRRQEAVEGEVVAQGSLNASNR